MQLYESYEWVKIPTDLPRKNLVMVIAKTLKTTVHPEDIEYPIRIFLPNELQEAARSLAQRPVGLNHMALIQNAFVVDSNWNDKEKCIEALLYLPDYYINRVKEGIINKVSVEYTWRDEEKTKEGTVFKGFVFNRIDLLERINAGDRNTEIRPVLMEGKKGLMEGEIKTEDTGETDIKQGVIQASVDEPSISFFKTEEEASQFFKSLGEPFAGYKDFDDCVAKNKDKKNPKAYCATIMRKVEQPKKETVSTPEMCIECESIESCESKPAICDKLIEEIDSCPEEELEEGEKYKPPEAGTLPSKGKRILAKAYSQCRTQYPEYSKTRCSKIAWGAVKNAGYVQKDGKWVKEESLGEASVLSKIPDVNIREANLTGKKPDDKQVPEIPVNPMASEPTPLTAIHNPTPQPLDPNTPVTAVGAIVTTEPPKTQEGGEDIKVVNDTTSAKQKVESTTDSSTNNTTVTNPTNVTNNTVNPTDNTQPSANPTTPVGNPTQPPTNTTPTQQTVQVPSIDAKDVRITELEGVVTTLQDKVKKADEDKNKAVEQAKQDLLKEFEEVLPDSNKIQNFNRGGQILANDIKRKIYKKKKEMGLIP